MINSTNNTFSIKEFCKLHKNKILLIFYVCLFLFAGTTTTVISKTAYQVQSETKDGTVMYFERPMFFNLLMFVGMFLALIVFYIQLFTKKLIFYIQQRNKPVFGSFDAEDQKEREKLTETSKNEEELSFDTSNDQKNKISSGVNLTWKQYLFIMIPSICDFGATYMQNFGLLYIPSSVFQMMRGSTIIFAMLLAIFWRKQKQYGFHYTGVVFIIFALIIVGVSMFIPSGIENESDKETSFSTSYSNSSKSLDQTEEEEDEWYMSLIGFCLIIAAQFLHALQTILEEILLHDLKAPISFLVGLRGFYGCILCAIVMVCFHFMEFLPDVFREDIVDTIYLLINNSTLIVLCLLKAIVVLMFNIAGTAVINYSNAMVKNILEPVRMIFVWIVSVFIYYVIDKALGEGLGYNTIVQVLGFILLVGGFFLYTKIIKIPKIFYYPELEESKFIELDGESNKKEEPTEIIESNEISDLPTFENIGNKSSSSSSSEEETKVEEKGDKTDEQDELVEPTEGGNVIEDL